MSENNNQSLGKRSETRLAIVKALYAGEINSKINIHKPAAGLTLDMIKLYHESASEDEVVNLDEELLAEVVQGVIEHLEILDVKINGHIGSGWNIERLGPVIRSVLRAAIFELMNYTSTPLKVIINEYVNITKNFFDEKEVGFVNGILDKIAHEVRGDE